MKKQKEKRGELLKPSPNEEVYKMLLLKVVIYILKLFPKYSGTLSVILI